MKTEDYKMTCIKKISNKSNDIIEENDIGKINDKIEHVSSRK